jgi:hypothetical protein
MTGRTAASCMLCVAMPPLWPQTLAFFLKIKCRGQVLSGGVALRTQWLGMPYGDQALFVSREALEMVSALPCTPALKLENVGNCGYLPLAAVLSNTGPLHMEKKQPCF